MDPDAAPEPGGHPAIQLDWTARKIHPVIVLRVVLVFALFCALAWFVFHSATGVRALVLAAVASIVSLAPGVLGRTEYRLTESGLESRSHHPSKDGAFRHVFHWDQLDHVRPMKHGFKFFRAMDERSPLRRFWKRHFSDSYSGEVQVETADRERVLGVLTDRGVRMEA